MQFHQPKMKISLWLSRNMVLQVWCCYTDLLLNRQPKYCREANVKLFIVSQMPALISAPKTNAWKTWYKGETQLELLDPN